MFPLFLFDINQFWKKIVVFLNFSLKSFGGSENSCTFASAFASERGFVSDGQVLFDRITWNREVVVQEASPLMFF